MDTAQFITKSFKDSIEKANFSWQTPSNIALVKYWGKSNPQIPKNASISFTLNNCHTITTIKFEKKEKTSSVDFELFFEQAGVYLLDVFGDYKLNKFNAKTSERLVLIFK